MASLGFFCSVLYFRLLYKGIVVWCCLASLTNKENIKWTWCNYCYMLISHSIVHGISQNATVGAPFWVLNPITLFHTCFFLNHIPKIKPGQSPLGKTLKHALFLKHQVIVLFARRNFKDHSHQPSYATLHPFMACLPSLLKCFLPFSRPSPNTSIQLAVAFEIYLVWMRSWKKRRGYGTKTLFNRVEWVDIWIRLWVSHVFKCSVMYWEQD